ncbi:MAG: hypothetical protein GY838_03700 [bacterium]|nr:hypothetical protein [bacterium]
MAQFFLATDRVADFVAHLMAQKPVFAPHPKGRRSYAFALTEQAADVVLDYPRTLHSVKKYFLPPREELLTFDLTANSGAVTEPEPTDAVFLGVHSYDLAAVHRLDFSFGHGNPERNYLTRRQGALFIGVSFAPDRFHFSGSVGIDPYDMTGCDAFLTKLDDGWVLDVLTAEGEALMDGFDLEPFTGTKPPRGHFTQHIYVPQAKLGDIMKRSHDHEVWAETADDCVGCGTCNLVCPTCYCFDVQEHVDVTVTQGSRERSWDGCMLRGFSEVAGGEVFREERAARQRHRVMRKFLYISAETGHPWCVGCGRCTQACTAGISIVDIVNRLVGDAERTAVAPV